MSPLQRSNSISIPSEAAMSELGAKMAGMLSPGDTVLLNGPIGAGKTHLARSIIRCILGEVEVPSPTFTLIQTYQAPQFEIVHADLYRLSDSSELIELGLDDAIGQAVVLIEWADRLPSDLVPSNALSLEIQPDVERREIVFSSSSAKWSPLTESAFDG